MIEACVERPAVDEDELSLRVPLLRLSADMRRTAAKLGLPDARWLIDMYYVIQEDRKRSDNQERSSFESGEPCQLIEWINSGMGRFEGSIKACLGEFAAAYRVGKWMQSMYGFGPVISSAMLANFDIRKAPTVGHFWRFAGLDPSVKWLGKEGAKKLVREILGDDKTATEEHLVEAARRVNRKVENIRRLLKDGKLTRKSLTDALARRPWNAQLKSICCFRLGETLYKFHKRDECFYGKLMIAKKVELEEANAEKRFAVEARRKLAEGKIGKTTEAYKRLLEDRLPQGQIHDRARRWTVKLFVSHLHHVMYWDYFGCEPPHPYIFEHPNNGLHAHLIEPPNCTGKFEGRPLKDLYR